MPDHGCDSRLAEYQPYWAARAELLAKAGAHEEARQAYEIAIGLERDPAVRRFLERRRSGSVVARDEIKRLPVQEPSGKPPRCRIIG